jgi:hypothetical protein
MSSKKMPMSSSLIALPPEGADIGRWACMPIVTANRAALSNVVRFMLAVLLGIYLQSYNVFQKKPAKKRKKIS